MKKAILIFLLCSSFYSLSYELPKHIIGQYEAYVPAFEFEFKGKTMQASGYNVQIYLKDNSLIYQCGNLKFKGVYTDLIESKNMLVIDVNITNQKSIDFKFRLNVDKKSETILMTGLSGVPETNMQKSDLVLYRH